MLMLLSPAKTLDLDPVDLKQVTTPRMLDQSEMLVRKMKRYKPASLKKLMKISDDLATLNHDRYQSFETPFTAENAKPALATFNGASYTDFELDAYDEDDYAFAQRSLRILSGLYGVLRPLDLIQPYRLEMGTRLKTRRGDRLTAFWGDRITDALNADLEGHDEKTVLNLASKEYFDAVSEARLNGKVVHAVFKNYSNGSYKVLGFLAKRARGSMANYVIRNRVDTLDGVRGFTAGGYAFNEAQSTEDTFVFLRKDKD